MPIHINFVQPVPPAVRTLRNALLVIGVLSLGLVLLQHRQLSEQKEALTWHLQDLRGLQTTSAARSSVENLAASGDQEEERAQLAEISRELNLPWDALFTALENAHRTDVVILSVAPDTSRETLTVEALAKNSTAVINFTDRLQSSPSLANIHLLEEELREDDARFPLRFSVNADWDPKGRSL